MLLSLQKKIFLLLFCAFGLTPILCWAKVDSDQVFESEDEFEEYERENTVEIYDPLEKVNRKIFVFNDYLDRYFIEHVAIFYRDSVPQKARSSIRNFLTNLSSPVSSLNSVLQGKIDNGLATFSSFLINSTVGIGGMFDVAGEKGILYKTEDFGQTLGHYGMNPGPYLVIPLLGPSSARDASGLVVDGSVNPTGFNLLSIGGSKNLIDGEYRLTLAALGGIDKRESLIDILASIRTESFDPYATIRSAYLQKRFTDIKF
jgi:phospholipid-binding lipoprotein MlaA